MTKEEKLQKRLNEICFPELAKTYDVFKVNDTLLWSSKKIRQLQIGYSPLNKITLELVLKALEIKFGNSISATSIVFLNKQCVIYGSNDNGEYKQLGFYELLKSFSQQPTETQEALYKIFEI